MSGGKGGTGKGRRRSEEIGNIELGKNLRTCDLDGELGRGRCETEIGMAGREKSDTDGARV